MACNERLTEIYYWLIFQFIIHKPQPVCFGCVGFENAIKGA